MMGRPAVGQTSREGGGSRQISILFPNETYDEIGHCAEINRESMNDVVRRAVNQYLAGEIVAVTPRRQITLARTLIQELNVVIDRLGGT
jgi:hypothetical protein